MEMASQMNISRQSTKQVAWWGWATLLPLRQTTKHFAEPNRVLTLYCSLEKRPLRISIGSMQMIKLERTQRNIGPTLGISLHFSIVLSTQRCLRALPFWEEWRRRRGREVGQREGGVRTLVWTWNIARIINSITKIKVFRRNFFANIGFIYYYKKFLVWKLNRETIYKE
jgi:hypothetical protein